MLLRCDRTMIAILIMLDVAFHAGRNGTVSAADIADRANLARRGIEPLLQTLCHAPDCWKASVARVGAIALAVRAATSCCPIFWRL